MKTLSLDSHLSEHFTLREMVQSATADKLGISNYPIDDGVDNLRALCQHVLEPLRRQFGPIIINSGYRCQKLNWAVGGVPNSQHLNGEAADLYCRDVEQARRYFDYIRRHLDFDQLMIERRTRSSAVWVHVSHVRQPGRRRNRHASLLKTVATEG